MSHAAIWARSSPVISVMLPGGIALDHAALRPISRALRRICLESSSRMPFGAVMVPAYTGSAAWHMLHRDRTISSMLAKLGGAQTAPALIAPGPAADSNAMATMPAPARPTPTTAIFFAACR